MLDMTTQTAQIKQQSELLKQRKAQFDSITNTKQAEFIDAQNRLSQITQDRNSKGKNYLSTLLTRLATALETLRAEVHLLKQQYDRELKRKERYEGFLKQEQERKEDEERQERERIEREKAKAEAADKAAYDLFVDDFGHKGTNRSPELL